MPVSLPNESAAYRAARNELLKAELALRAQTEEVAALRRALPEGGLVAQDYGFRSTSGAEVSMRELFGENSTLAIYSLMYGPEAKAACPMCSAFLDGWRGQVSHAGANGVCRCRAILTRAAGGAASGEGMAGTAALFC